MKADLIKLPALEMEYFTDDEGNTTYTAWLEGTGIVVSGDSKEDVINEMMISIRVQLLYEYRINNPLP